MPTNMSELATVDNDASWHIKELVEVTRQKVVIQLYPELTPESPTAERAYAAMLNKSELEASGLSHEQRIKVLAIQCGISS